MDDALALLDDLAARRRSAVEVVAETLDALCAVHERTNAVVALEPDRSLADARALDAAAHRGEALGPLHGLPVTVKDWIDVEGFTCAGETSDRERRPARDATVVARLRAAGAVVVAKTAAWGPDTDAGRVRHPDNDAWSPGGSSTGEAVVVAAGASPLGIGSDSGGSIRLPAAWCGVAGLKPTAGLVPTTGHFPRVGALSDGRTQIGPLSASVELLGRVLAVLAGPDGLDAGVAPVPLGPFPDLAGRRLAVLHGESGWQPEREIVDALERAAGILAGAGAIRVELGLRWLDEALDITRRYWHREELTGAEVAQQLWDWDVFRRRYLRAIAGTDLVLAPVAASPAPAHRPIVADDFVFTLPASLTGSPALSVPAGRDAGGRPLAVQVIGRPWEDRLVLVAGAALTAAR